MARRSNFIEGNDNFREQNLRFVRNEFEDNINQFFGGANPGGGGSQQKPPPRDSLIVQPTPGGPPDHSEPGRNLELDTRRQFIRDLGASRMTANALAVRSFKVPDFNLRYFQRQRFRLSVELGDSRQNVVDAEVLRAIGEAVEIRDQDLESRPRTPSPPRNIDWHKVNRDDSPGRNDNRSRPRDRQGVTDFRGARNNSRGFVDQQPPEREREHFNRNAVPKNVPNNRYNRNLDSDNQNSNPDNFNRNNRNANQQEFNRNNRYANTQEFNRYNRKSDEFNRNSNPQQEFHRFNHNANPQMGFNPNNRNENPEINRNNRNVNRQALIRNPNPQETYRNNRNANIDAFNRNNRNENRNSNPQDFNRNLNPQEFNRNMNPQGNRNLPPNFNRNASPEENRNFRGPKLNPREIPQNFNNPRFNNNNRGPHRGPGNNDFMPHQQSNVDRNAMIDQHRDIDDNFLESRDHPKQQPHSDFRQLQHNLAGNSGPPQIGRNYQRIVKNNQITLCRADWIEANRELDIRNPDNFGSNNRNLNDNFRHHDGPILEDDDRFHRPQHSVIRRPGFRGPEDLIDQDDYDHNFEGYQESFRNQSDNDPNFHGRGRNDRNYRRQFNEDYYENDRSRSIDSVSPEASPNRYHRDVERGSGLGDRYHCDQAPQSAKPNKNRPNLGRNAPIPRQISTSQDRTTARSTSSSGRNPRSISKVSQDRTPAKKNTNSVGPKQPRSNPDRNPRSTSLASPNRSSTGSQKPSQARSALRNVKPADANPQKAKSSDIKSGLQPNNRGSTQNKPNRTTSEVKNTNSGASKPLTTRKNAPTAIASAGICVKSFKVNSNEKFFINVCQAPEVPAPEDVTEEELIAILESTTPGSFRVPMSISEPRHTKDRSDKTVDVCDIAINPKFLVKIQKSQLFNNFFLQIVAEAMSEKYNVQLNMQKTITLNNRKFIGTLVSHRVRNDDVKRAQPGSDGVQNAITDQDQAVTPNKSGKLVQEINEKDAVAIKNIRSLVRGGQELQYKLRARVRDDKVDEIHAEIYLPNCVSSQEVNLDVGEDRILVESHKHGYVFDKFVNYHLQQDRAQALFDKTSKMLQIRIPVLIN